MTRGPQAEQAQQSFLGEHEHAGVALLNGLNVVDMGTGGVGPWAGAMMAYLGCDVIKVEPPWGDWIAQQEPVRSGSSIVYGANNWMKPVERLDYRSEPGRSRLLGLVREADVLIENFRSGTLERHGLGYDALREENPRLVYCSATGFGNDGPLADWACTDPHIQVYSGFADSLGEMLRWFGCLDRVTSLAIVQACLVGLVRRAATQTGCHLRTSMLAACLWFLRDDEHVTDALASARDVRILRCLDGFVLIARAGSASEAVEHALLDDHAGKLTTGTQDAWSRVAELTGKRTRNWVARRLASRGVMHAPLLTTAEVALGAPDAFEERVLPGWGPARLPRWPLARLDRQPHR